MDYAALASVLQQSVPLNNHLGLEVAEVGPGLGVVRLPEDGRIVNHVGSQHAGGLFTAGEAASGGAFIGAFAEQLAEVTPLAERAEIAYRKIARGPITATARLEGADRLVAELAEAGVVRFGVPVELTDAEGTVVADMTVHWYVKRNG